jgi:hypothetical protein
VTPNNVRTTFTGDRISQTVVPIIEDVVAAFNLSPTDKVTGSLGTVGNCDGVTLKENNPNALPMLKSYAERTPGPTANQYASGSQPWSAVFISFILSSADPDFPKSALHYNYITSAMKGEKGYELFPLSSGLKIKAEPGDLLCKKRDGGTTAAHCDVIYSATNDKTYLVGGNLSDSIGLVQINLDNGYITDNSKSSYKILIKKTNNKYYSGENLLNVNGCSNTSDGFIGEYQCKAKSSIKGTQKIEGSVINIGSITSVVKTEIDKWGGNCEENSDNKNYESTKGEADTITGGKADYWSLVAICCLEAGNPQARADVAQSIYNRLATPNKPYGKSIKEIIVADQQYEPTFKNKNDWKVIKDKQTAITAVKNSKNWSNEKAKKAIEDTEKALKDITLQNNSINFIKTRTEFLAGKPESNKAEGVVERDPNDNAFFWAYAGKALIGKTPPNPPDFNVT